MLCVWLQRLLNKKLLEEWAKYTVDKVNSI